ncbi:MAG: cytidine/deoxycytidylate deaminase family protein [Candidatus Aenigmarchaeota archaeon]|nr:cytidine/deoxycytidylate deaminase family protein [Candidatus Aenigmarchaeota archaeon]
MKRRVIIITRLSWDEYFLEIMRKVGERSTCDRGKPGSVIVKDNRIIATGYAGSPTGLPHCDDEGHILRNVLQDDGTIRQHCVRTIHAEQNAICQAARFGISLEGSTLYLKFTPCPVCAKMIINSGIKRIVAEKGYHGVYETPDLFKRAGIRFEIINPEIEKYDNMQITKS